MLTRRHQGDHIFETSPHGHWNLSVSGRVIRRGNFSSGISQKGLFSQPCQSRGLEHSDAQEHNKKAIGEQARTGKHSIIVSLASLKQWPPKRLAEKYVASPKRGQSGCLSSSILCCGTFGKGAKAAEQGSCLLLFGSCEVMGHHGACQECRGPSEEGCRFWFRLCSACIKFLLVSWKALVVIDSHL